MSRKLILLPVLLAFLVMPLFGCSNNTLNVTMNNLGTITGYVVDSVTGVAISGASVSSGIYETTTNLSGYYSLTLPGGPRPITASAAKYISQTATVTIVAEDTVNLPFSLVKVFTDTGTVQGSVVNKANNNPISGATIIFTGSDNASHTVTSGFQGSYTIDLPSGVYAINVVASGYLNYTMNYTVRTGTIFTLNFPMTLP